VCSACRGQGFESPVGSGQRLHGKLAPVASLVSVHHLRPRTGLVSDDGGHSAVLNIDEGFLHFCCSVKLLRALIPFILKGIFL